jgi:hypothetical protein
MTSIGCLQTFSAENDHVPKAIALISSMNFYGEANGKLVSQIISDSTSIISYDDCYIYKKAMIVTSDTVFMKSDSTVSREKKGRGDTIPRCYVYKANENSGFIFNGADAAAAGTFAVDSFLKENANDNVNVNDYLILSSTYLANGTIEYYTPKAKKDANTPDSIILSYQTNMKDILFYSFCFDLENKKQQKLVSVQYILNATAKMPEQRVSLAISEIPVTDISFLKKLTRMVNEMYKHKKA